MSAQLQTSARNPILVTGAHRSGTTWVGRMIALSPSVLYLNEPFNPTHDRGICAAPINRWWMHINENNEASYYQDIERMLSLRYSVRGKLGESVKPRNFAHAIRGYLRFANYRRRRMRPLMKDPAALFSAPWLASRFATDVIVMIRHPGAFVSSIKAGNWRFPFAHWLEQPSLMEDLLAPFRAEIELHAREQQDIIDEASLLWNCMHHVIQHYRQAHQEWQFVRHEDLSREPVAEFKRLYQWLGFPFTDEIRATIIDHSAASNPVGSRERRYEVKLDSRSTIWSWSNRLSDDEIRRIRRNVEAVSSFFYSEEDWSCPKASASPIGATSMLKTRSD